MKELNHLKEVNHVYNVIDQEMFGTTTQDYDVQSEGQASKLSFVSTQKIRSTFMSRSPGAAAKT